MHYVTAHQAELLRRYNRLSSSQLQEKDSVSRFAFLPQSTGTGRHNQIRSCADDANPPVPKQSPAKLSPQNHRMFSRISFGLYRTLAKEGQELGLLGANSPGRVVWSDEGALLRDWVGSRAHVFFDLGDEQVLWWLAPNPNNEWGY